MRPTLVLGTLVIVAFFSARGFTALVGASIFPSPTAFAAPAIDAAPSPRALRDAVGRHPDRRRPLPGRSVER